MSWICKCQFIKADWYIPWLKLDVTLLVETKACSRLRALITYLIQLAQSLLISTLESAESIQIFFCQSFILKKGSVMLDRGVVCVSKEEQMVLQLLFDEL